MSKTYTITAALPYTNGPIHIGHLSGVYIPADIYARFLRITGNEVIYICGSDEHGVPITIKAKKEKKPLKKLSIGITKILKSLLISLEFLLTTIPEPQLKSIIKLPLNFF